MPAGQSRDREVNRIELRVIPGKAISCLERVRLVAALEVEAQRRGNSPPSGSPFGQPEQGEAVRKGVVFHFRSSVRIKKRRQIARTPYKNLLWYGLA